MTTNRQVEIATPLGDDVLLFESMIATEQLGRLFTFEIDLLSKDADIRLEDVLGQDMTVKVALPDGGTRYFNGYVSRFNQAGMSGNYAAYQATLRPWFWFLTRTADCRIFQNKKVPEIIKEILGEHGFSGLIEDTLSGKYREWEYCVQYRETDFNFLSRLMEQEGIYYFFEHREGKHILVLSDDYGSHATTSGYETIPYYPPDQHDRRERDHISEWLITQEVQPGAYVLNEYDFEKPKANLETKRIIKRQHVKADFEIFDYPGEYTNAADGENYVRARIEELQAQHEVVSGGGNARGVSVGSLFSLKGYPRDDQNREYLLVSATYQLEMDAYESTGSGGSGPVYSCSFSAIDSKEPYRAPRTTPKPVVQGPQTAIVVGKSGEEIWTDSNGYGRVKVQFHWDRYGKSDENSSCWVRVAQVWAGKGWGAIHIPRIGQEVIVEFLEGDPDQPIITGCVYNEDNKPPYDLPNNQTQSGIKSRSTKGGNVDNCNEIRFEDKKDAEEIYIHAEKDFQRVVENNDTLKVGFDKKDPGDQAVDIYNNRTTTLKQGNDKLTVEKGGHGIKISLGKSETEAMKSIELKVGANSVKIDQTGVTIKGTMIKIEGKAMVNVKGAMTEIKGDAMVTISGGLVKVN